MQSSLRAALVVTAIASLVPLAAGAPGGAPPAPRP